MLLAHLDVPAQASGWTRNPFRATVKNGRVYGAGVRDMKAGLAAMAMAMRAVREARVPLEGDLLFVAVPGHMEQGVGAKRVFDAGVTADLILVGEPTGLDLLSTHLGWSVLELTVHGRETSTVNRREGVNAAERAATVIGSLSRMRSARPGIEVRPPVPPATPCYLSTVGILGGNPHYPNVVPGQCTLTVDVRYVPGKRPAGDSPGGPCTPGGAAPDGSVPPRHRPTQVRFCARAGLDPPGGSPVPPHPGRRPVGPWNRTEAVRVLYTTDGGVFQEGSGSPTVVCGPGHAPLRLRRMGIDARVLPVHGDLRQGGAGDVWPDSEGGGHRLSVAPDSPEPILTLLVKLR